MSFFSASDNFDWNLSHFELKRLGTQSWMLGRKMNRASLLFGADPDCPRATDQGKRIVADDLGRALQREVNGVVGVGADGVELICDTENDTGGVGPVGEQSRIVRQDRELAVNSATRKRLRDDQLTLE